MKYKINIKNIKTKIALIISFLLIAGLTLNGHAINNKKRVAILSFTANNVQKAFARIVRNNVEITYFKEQKFQLLEQRKIDLVLKTQRNNQKICNKANCAIDLGQLLKVDYVVIGSIDKLNTYTINIKVVNVKEKRIQGVESIEVKKLENLKQKVSLATQILINNLLTKQTAINKTKIKQTQTNNKSKKSKKSIHLAASASLVPVWSGSFHTGFDVIGLGFVASKIASFGFMAFSIHKYTITNDNLNSYNRQLSQSLYGSTQYANLLLEKRKTEDLLKTRKFYVGISISLFVIATLADCIYSFYKTKYFNNLISDKKETTPNTLNEEFAVHFQPIFNMHNHAFNPEYGFSITLQYFF